MPPRFHRHHHGGPPRHAHSGPSLPMPSETSSEMRLLEPGGLAFRHQGARFQARVDGEWQDVSVVRLFPQSDPEGWIALIDSEGREAGILLEARKLPREALACLREEFHRRYLVPQVARILSARRRLGVVTWVVETDRGEFTFRTRHLGHQIKDPDSARLSLIDVEGNRFDIPDVGALDPESRRRLDTHI